MGVKKAVPARRSVQVEAPVKTQTTLERKVAEAEMRVLIEKFSPAHVKLVGTTQRLLRKRLPTAHEVVYEYRDFVVVSFSPSGHGYEGVLGIHAGADGGKLFFNRGKELPDPAKLLKGSGSLVRSILVEDTATLARPEVVSLID